MGGGGDEGGDRQSLPARGTRRGRHTRATGGPPPTRSPTQAQGPGGSETATRAEHFQNPHSTAWTPRGRGGDSERGNREQERLSAITQGVQAGPPFPEP